VLFSGLGPLPPTWEHQRERPRKHPVGMVAGERTGEAAHLSRLGWWRGRALSSGFLREKDVGIRSDVKLVETGNSLCGEEEGLAGDRLYLHLWK